VKIILIAITFIFLFSSCTSSDKTDIFKLHVYNGDIGNVFNLRSGTVKCMHCPSYFRFEAVPEIVNYIKAFHKLKEIDHYPEIVNQINNLINDEVNWWGLTKQSSNLKIFWVNYISKHNNSEPEFRVLIIKGKFVYFITTKNFNLENYEASQV